MLLFCSAAQVRAAQSQPAILVVGSVNVDIIADVGRLPSSGETLTATKPAAATAVGGKGANQAVAAARLGVGSGRAVRFVGRFGNDSHAAMLEAALVAEGVDVSQSRHVGLPSGQGWVLLEPDGTATSVVLGGSNTAFEQVRGLPVGGDCADGLLQAMKPWQSNHFRTVDHPGNRGTEQ